MEAPAPPPTEIQRVAAEAAIHAIPEAPAPEATTYYVSEAPAPSPSNMVAEITKVAASAAINAIAEAPAPPPSTEIDVPEAPAPPPIVKIAADAAIDIIEGDNIYIKKCIKEINPESKLVVVYGSFYYYFLKLKYNKRKKTIPEFLDKIVKNLESHKDKEKEEYKKVIEFAKCLDEKNKINLIPKFTNPVEVAANAAITAIPGGTAGSPGQPPEKDVTWYY